MPSMVFLAAADVVFVFLFFVWFLRRPD